MDLNSADGIYNVVNFDITVANGSIMKLTAVVNCGVSNMGYWGAIFIRNSSKKVITICSYSGGCTEVTEVSSNLSSFVKFDDDGATFLHLSSLMTMCLICLRITRIPTFHNSVITCPRELVRHSLRRLLEWQ